VFVFRFVGGPSPAVSAELMVLPCGSRHTRPWQLPGFAIAAGWTTPRGSRSAEREAESIAPMTSNPTATAATAAPEERFALTWSRLFPDWLARMGASLAFTTYQAGKV